MRLKKVRREKLGIGSLVDVSELGGTQHRMAETGQRRPARILLARTGNLLRLEMFRPIRDKLIDIGECPGSLAGGGATRQGAQVEPFDLLLALPGKLVHKP